MAEERAALKNPRLRRARDFWAELAEQDIHPLAIVLREWRVVHFRHTIACMIVIGTI